MLFKNLPKIAARILHDTKGLPPQYKQRLELVQEAYGSSTVEIDFEKWCEESKDHGYRYPVSEYLKVIDSRLGDAPKEDENDPRVETISALTYKLTRRPAPSKNVRELLMQFSLEDIASALQEYVDGIEDREYAFAARMFFVDGGCGAIITSRRQRDQDRKNQIEKDAQEKNLIASLVAEEKRKSDAEDLKRESDAAKPKPTGAQLFGHRTDL